MGAFVIARLELAVGATQREAVERFYAQTLGLAPGPLAFRPIGAGRPFYHFALLLPGDRFAAARAWLAERVELLPGPDGSTRFDFAGWPAIAAYFHDPAGSIVELIAHPGIGESGLGDAPFAPDELIGISEVGVVTPDPAAAAETLRAGAGIAVWDGAASAGFAFAGRRAHTLILCPPGRGWLPTGRPAELHPLTVTTAGGAVVEVEPGGRLTVRR
jgi:hypothetical protein